MRFPPLLLITLALALVFAPPALGADGGSTSPPSGGGGSIYDQSVPTTDTREPAPRPRTRRRRARRRGRGPLLTAFRLTRPRLFLYGRPARVNFRIDSRARTVRVRLYVIDPARPRQPVSTVFLGDRPTGVNQSYLLTGRENGVLGQGRYQLRIAARDPRGRRLRRAASASSSAELGFFHHRFPLAGPFSYGGEGSRFGAPRHGHIHQGQDLTASEGVPIVAPRGGVIETVAYQAGGAGHYAVLDGEGEDRDYVFMHMRRGSVRVSEGQRVRTGQRIGDVGNTGGSSGAHLHFEIWVGGWYANGGKPIDPLRVLRAWDRWS